MQIIITGSDGFIGRNLRLHLEEIGGVNVIGISRSTPQDSMIDSLTNADFVFHLAGVNRPLDDAEFFEGNVRFTEEVCATLRDAKRPIPMALASSTQATHDNPYGRSKLAAEAIVRDYARVTGAATHVFRLPNVFGKWARPNYNSAVATFCYNRARNLPITVHDSAARIRLAYIDDVVRCFTAALPPAVAPDGFAPVAPVYELAVGDLAAQIEEIAATRAVFAVPRVGVGFSRALYATYISYLPIASLTYDLVRHEDPRGMFSEVLRTSDCGQLSFFTAKPGVVRGGHYHHSKTEKFVVVNGSAEFTFRHIVTEEHYAVTVTARDARVIEPAPGWVHNVRNTGTDDLVVMAWANENFDPDHPDTFRSDAIA